MTVTCCKCFTRTNKFMCPKCDHRNCTSCRPTVRARARARTEVPKATTKDAIVRAAVQLAIKRAKDEDFLFTVKLPDARIFDVYRVMAGEQEGRLAVRIKKLSREVVEADLMPGALDAQAVAAELMRTTEH